MGGTQSTCLPGIDLENCDTNPEDRDRALRQRRKRWKDAVNAIEEEDEDGQEDTKKIYSEATMEPFPLSARNNSVNTAGSYGGSYAGSYGLNCLPSAEGAAGYSAGPLSGTCPMLVPTGDDPTVVDRIHNPGQQYRRSLAKMAAEGDNDDMEAESAAIALPKGPMRHTVPTYETADRDALSGELQAGEVAQLRIGERIQRVCLTVYENGMSVTPLSEEDMESVKPHSRAWSPFTLVETCQVQATRQDHSMAVFKLTILRKECSDLFYYFGCCGPEAQEQRDRWLSIIQKAISKVTMSLIPEHAIRVRPVPGVPGTVSRLMAGYLMRLVEADVVALYYCELQAYSEGEAKLMLYQDEWCEHEVGNVAISNTSVVSTRKGEYCTILGMDSSLFCARTWKEKELWLRAVSNVKVKLMFDAPSPTQEELDVYRSAVLERVEEVIGLQDRPRSERGERTGEHSPEGSSVAEEGLAAQASAVASPLLAPRRGRPPVLTPRGDVWQPEPIDSPGGTPPGSPRGHSKAGPEAATAAGVPSVSGVAFSFNPVAWDCPRLNPGVGERQPAPQSIFTQPECDFVPPAPIAETMAPMRPVAGNGGSFLTESPSREAILAANRIAGAVESDPGLAAARQGANKLAGIHEACDRAALMADTAPPPAPPTSMLDDCPPQVQMPPPPPPEYNTGIAPPTLVRERMQEIVTPQVAAADSLPADNLAAATATEGEPAAVPVTS
eukprot:TRINITY_DN22838_c0_g1_i1.p1 TRINITY_DN22838_c0_g1~~TRINITY_DN22838_c0_g1_i1.p1  ORF type:complete len:725 (+),score=171.52 TRINITY_DN22838_c0_g1_i1:119-2293(+)